MRVILDTQIFIWHASGSVRNLRPEANQMINDLQNIIFLSHVSLFEIAIKQKIGKLDVLPISVSQIIELAQEKGFALLPVTAAHIATYDRIPLIDNHRDPFDRLLLATALAESIPIITADEHFPQYSPLVSVIAG